MRLGRFFLLPWLQLITNGRNSIFLDSLQGQFVTKIAFKMGDYLLLVAECQMSRVKGENFISILRLRRYSVLKERRGNVLFTFSIIFSRGSSSLSSSSSSRLYHGARKAIHPSISTLLRVPRLLKCNMRSLHFFSALFVYLKILQRLAKGHKCWKLTPIVLCILGAAWMVWHGRRKRRCRWNIICQIRKSISPKSHLSRSAKYKMPFPRLLCCYRQQQPKSSAVKKTFPEPHSSKL